MTDRTLPPMTSSSRLLRVFWWLACLTPPINFLLALITSANAVEVVISVPLIIGTLLLAPVVAIRAVASPVLSRSQKVSAVTLSLSVFPMYVLVSAVWWWLGPRGRGVSSAGMAGLVAAIAAWIGLTLALHRVLRPRSQ